MALDRLPPNPDAAQAPRLRPSNRTHNTVGERHPMPRGSTAPTPAAGLRMMQNPMGPTVTPTAPAAAPAGPAPGSQSNIPPQQQAMELFQTIMDQIRNGQAAQVAQILQMPQGQQLVAALPPEMQQQITQALQQALQAAPAAAAPAAAAPGPGGILGPAPGPGPGGLSQPQGVFGP